MGKFIIKHINKNKPQKKTEVTKENKVEVNTKYTINEEKTEIVMTTSEKIAMAQEVLNNNSASNNNFKRVKKDKGLIERTESSKTILTEDNKELLKD